MGLEEHGLIRWDYGAIDGAFSPWKGGGESVARGRKGKGILIHSFTETHGMSLVHRTTPANGDERAQVLLLDAVKLRTGKRRRPRTRLKVLATDKGYDAKALRQQLRSRGIRAQLPRRVWKTNAGGISTISPLTSSALPSPLYKSSILARVLVLITRGCNRAIPNHMVELRELESQWVVDASSERMGLLARGPFGEMVEISNLHHSAHKEPLHEPYYANQSPVDNDI